VKTILGPALFLAQYMGGKAPFDTLENMARWASALGYKALQLPTDVRLFNLELAAQSQAYCDDIAGMLAQHGLQVSELSTHLQGQLLAVHPAYDVLFDGFAPPALRGDAAARTAWAEDQLHCAAIASRRLGLRAHVTFSGALAWPYLYPWPQRPAGLVETAFAELARRWRPVLDAFDDAGVDLCYELHPGEDLHDGVTFERFLEAVDHHPRASIPAISCCSSWTTWPSSTSTTGASRRSTSRMRNSVPAAGKASTADFPTGRNGPDASARWATARSISRPSFPRWRSTIFPAGRCWNGNARSSIPKTAQPRARNSSAAISSASANALSTILPAPRCQPRRLHKY
jgi:sugar phosphate isomerase/epimerase